MLDWPKYTGISNAEESKLMKKSYKRKFKKEKNEKERRISRGYYGALVITAHLPHSYSSTLALGLLRGICLFCPNLLGFFPGMTYFYLFFLVFQNLYGK